MTRRYWETVGGTLVLEFPVVNASRSHGIGRRVVDALIIPEDERREARPEEVEIKGKDVIVVQTKARRLGMYLMGQAFFSRELVKELGPRSVRTVALCRESDAKMRELCDRFGIEVQLDIPD